MPRKITVVGLNAANAIARAQTAANGAEADAAAAASSATAAATKATEADAAAVEAMGYRDQARDISQIDVSDDVMAAVAADPASAFSSGLSASTGAQIEADVPPLVEAAVTTQTAELIEPGAATPRAAVDSRVRAGTGDLGLAKDNSTDDSTGINALGPESGLRLLGNGKILARRPIRVPKNTTLAGWIATTAANSTGTSIPNGIKFVSASFMANGNSATVTADGTEWTFTVPTQHGVQVGDIVEGYDFATAGFNKKPHTVTAVTSTQVKVANTSVPAASDSGFLAIALIVLGSDVAATQSASMLRDVWVECSDIPGSIGVFSSTIQEAAGLDRVNVVRATHRGVLIDGTDPFATGAKPLNYDIKTVRTVGSDFAKAGYSGLEVRGNNLSLRGLDGLTCTGGGSGADLPAAQVRLDGCRTGVFERIHVENCVDGVLIGERVACIGAQVSAVTGHSTVTNAVVRIATPATGTNQQLVVGGVMPNGSAKGLQDDQTGYSATGHHGLYVTDATGKRVVNTQVDRLATTATAGSDVTLAVGVNTNILSLSLPVGRWLVQGQVTIVPGASTTSVEVTNTVGTATATMAGVRASSVPITSGKEPVSVPICFVAEVSVAGSVTVRAKPQGAAATAKAQSVGGTNGATAAIATAL